MGCCGIDIRARSRKLYLNYRTTDEIRKQAVALLEGRDIDDLDGGQDDIAAINRSRMARCRNRDGDYCG
jgi:hypothetical protein